MLVNWKEGSIGYLESGKGPAMVLLHGLGGPSSFRRAVPLLAQTHRVLQVNLPGFGDSPRPQHRLTVKAWAEAMAFVLDATSASPAVLVGHSLGGMVAQYVAAGWPDRVSHLVLTNTFVRTSPSRLATMRARAAAAREQGMAVIADMTSGFLFGHRQDESGRRFAAEQSEAMLAIDPETYAQACEALADCSTAEQLSAIRCPTLTVSGDCDSSSDAAVNQELTAGITGAQSVFLNGCGHLAPLEEPDEYVAAIRKFLQSTSRPIHTPTS